MNSDECLRPCPRPNCRRTGRAASCAIPELFPDRAGRRRPGRHHLLSDLVVRHLGRWPGPAVRSGGLSAGNLSAVRDPGSGLIVAVIALTLLGFLTANLIGRTLVDLGRCCSAGCRSCARSIAA